jgi:hypothetical protein
VPDTSHPADPLALADRSPMEGLEDTIPAVPRSAHRRARQASLRRRRQRLLIVLPIFILVSVFYFWTASPEGDAIKFGAQTDAYNELTEAVLHGHLSLLFPPPKGLLALKNPYNPLKNGQWQRQIQYHDLALYNGHFYLTWGPTPVFTLLLPWRILHVGGMPLNLAVFIYCDLGFLFTVALLFFLTDRYLPDTKTWKLVLATIAIGFSTVAPFLLRRPAVYELAISSAFCFAMLGAYLLASGGLGPRVRRWRLAMGSVSIGLAAAARPDLVFEALLLALLFWFLLATRGPWTRRSLVRLGGILFGPFLGLFGLLLAYNDVRFGGLFNNGASYVLAGYDPRARQTFQLSYLTPNLYYYIAAPVRWTLAFPYFALPPPPSYPGGVPVDYSSEITAGILTTTPILFTLVAAVPFLWRRRLRSEFGRVLISLVVVGLLVLLFVCLALWGATMRYEPDFVPFFLVPALLMWFALSRLRWRRVVSSLGVLAILYGCIAGAAISMTGYYDYLRTNEPGAYWTLAESTSVFPTLATMFIGHPVVSRVTNYENRSYGEEYTYDLNEMGFIINLPTEVDIVSPSGGKWALAPTFSRWSPGYKVVLSIRNAADPRARAQIVPIGVRPQGLVLSLHRGLNRFALSSSAAGGSGSAAWVVVNGISIAKQVHSR